MNEPWQRVFPNLLTPDECRDFIEQAEAQGYLDMSSDYPPTYRDNDRIVIDSTDLAEKLFERFRNHLPERIERVGESWRLEGLNTRFRGCRYTAGQKFVRHRDGAHSEGDSQRSFLTLMLYLNDQSEFQGGHTRFYTDRFSPEPSTSVPPQTGSGIVFDHSLWHDGEAVTDGVKYVLRTDVMYRCTSGSSTGHSGYVWCLSELDNGLLASGSRDKTVRLWKNREPLAVLDHHLASVTCLSALQNEFWSGSRDRSVVRWQRESDNRWLPYPAGEHRGTVLSLTPLPTGGLVSSGADGRLLFWSRNGSPRGELKCPAWPWAVACGRDGKLLVGCDDGSLMLLQRDSRQLELWQKAPCGIHSLAIDESGLIFAGCADGRIRRWQRYGRELQPWTGHRGTVTTLLLIKGGRVVSGSEDDGVRQWSEGESEVLVEHHDFVRAVCLAEGASTVVSASYDGTLNWTQLWHLGSAPE